MTVSRPIHDTRHALGTDRVHVALMEGEVSAAEAAEGGVAFAWGTAGRAADDRRLMVARSGHPQGLIAQTAKLAARGAVGRIVLLIADGTGDEQSHGARIFDPGTRVKRIQA